MTQLLNFTPHQLNIYAPTQLIALERVRPGLWLADGVSVDSADHYPIYPEAIPLRVSGEPVAQEPLQLESGEIPVYALEGKAIEGLSKALRIIAEAEQSGEPVFIVVSRETKTAAMQMSLPIAAKMLLAHNIVRDRNDQRVVIGALGLIF